MPLDVLLGLQWGDEGKGKVVDYLAPQYDVIARFQGGPNAGHTLEFDGIKHVLHQIPSGIFHEHIVNIIGNGVVLDPVVFSKEVEGLRAYGVRFDNLHISKRAQLILPTHRLLDQAYEQAMGEQKIGSTLKGIGPCYQDKIGRHGLRVGDIVMPDFRQRYFRLVERHQRVLDHFKFSGYSPSLDDFFFETVELLHSFKLIDSEYILNGLLSEGKRVLAEGAQGSMLDIDFGSYPYVTSSSTMVAGAASGLGIAPKHFGKVFGIIKAYSTRVGGGPFLTELTDDMGEFLRRKGHEFGSTTGRPRRTGWLDLPAIKYAIMLNAVDQLFLMKVDVLDSLDTIQVCTKYKGANGFTDHLVHEIYDGGFVPEFISLQGWGSATGSIRHRDEIPESLIRYIEYLEHHLATPIRMISTGPDRVQTIVL